MNATSLQPVVRSLLALTACAAAGLAGAGEPQTDAAPEASQRDVDPRYRLELLPPVRSLAQSEEIRLRLSLTNDAGDEVAWLEGEIPAEAIPEDLELHEIDFDFVVPTPVPEQLDELAGDGRQKPFQLAPTLRFAMDRPTALRDGGISGQAKQIKSSFTRSATGRDPDRFTSLAQGDGEFDMYNVTLSWDAYKDGPVTLSVLSGLRAIRADVRQSLDRDGVSRYEEQIGVVPVPVIGGGVRMDLHQGVFVTGSAATQTFGDATLLDITAETGFDLSPTIGIRAGYKLIESALSVRGLDTELNQEGYFARLQIDF